MTDLIWLKEAEKNVDHTLKPLEARIKKAQRELEKNPTFQFLERAREKYSGRDKHEVNFTNFNPSYDFHTHALLKRKIQTLARKSEIKVIYSTDYTAEERHPEYLSYTLVEYVTNNKDLAGIYGLQSRTVCSCPQDKTNLDIFSMKGKHQISEITEEILAQEKRKSCYYFHSTSGNKIANQLDWVFWDFGGTGCGGRSQKHYEALLPRKLK